MRALLFLPVLFLAACGTTAPPDIDEAAGHVKIGKPYQIKGQWYYPEYEPGYVETGIASWYGDQFHGRPTANGETFHKMAMTAAHTTMPLPSYAEVTNLETGKSITVRVNDRGPFVHDRLIDLSQGAAQELGFEHNGLAEVRVEFKGFAPAASGDFPDVPAKVASQPAKTSKKAVIADTATTIVDIPATTSKSTVTRTTLASVTPSVRPSATDSTHVQQATTIASTRTEPASTNQCVTRSDNVVVSSYNSVSDAQAMVRFLNDSPWAELPRNATMRMVDNRATVLVGPVSDSQQGRIILSRLDSLGIQHAGTQSLTRPC